MKIAMISGDFPPILSGLGDVVHQLSSRLSQQDMVRVFSTRSQNLPTGQTERADAIAEPGWDRASVDRILEQCRDVDLVNLHYPGTQYRRSLWVNAIPYLVRRRLNKPCLVTLHDFGSMTKQYRVRALPMLAGASAIIHVDPADNAVVRRWFIRSAWVPPMYHVPIGITISPEPISQEQRHHYRAELGFDSGDIVILYFGILYPHKGVDDLVQAYRILRERHDNLRLLVVGDFDRDAPYVADMSRMLDTPDIRWVRDARNQRASQCLFASDIAALPYHQGAAANRSALLSCLAHGLPTVSTRSPVTPGDFDQRYGVTLVPIRQPEALAEVLHQWVVDPAHRRHQGDLALQAVSRLSWPHIAQQTREVFHSTLSAFRSKS
jgi:glycosyltransferase involved in cell wall biosynthesis